MDYEKYKSALLLLCFCFTQTNTDTVSGFKAWVIVHTRTFATNKTPKRNAYSRKALHYLVTQLTLRFFEAARAFTRKKKI